jgi:predicted nucleic acid-binding protein
VVDASLALKWYLPEVHHEAALRLLAPDVRLHAPDLLHAEVGNILWKKVRRREITDAQARLIRGGFAAVPLATHPMASLLEGALDIALATEQSVYDGMYVALAVALGAPLVTADRRLVEALRRTPLAAHVVWVEDVT